ncbi:MAG: hypothetical protein DMG13_12400 [Acidobacteria bacterium]|nr:MAG: hypothetical protein DMG13_12400 [Acidobacteriota bacterium]
MEWSVQDDRRGTPVTAQHVVIGNVGRIVTGNIVEAMQLRLAEGDDGYETAPRFSAWLFRSSMLRSKGHMRVVSHWTLDETALLISISGKSPNKLGSH